MEAADAAAVRMFAANLSQKSALIPRATALIAHLMNQQAPQRVRYVPHWASIVNPAGMPVGLI